MPRTASRLCAVIAILALVLAQLLALAHDAEPAHADDAACHLCIAVHGLGAAAVGNGIQHPLPPPVSLGDWPGPDVLPTVQRVAVLRARGPPIVSVI